MLDDFYLRCRCPGIDGFETAHCLPQIVARDAAVTALVREVRWQYLRQALAYMEQAGPDPVATVAWRTVAGVADADAWLTSLWDGRNDPSHFRGLIALARSADAADLAGAIAPREPAAMACGCCG